MPNPLFGALGGAQVPQGGPMGMIQAFQKFMMQNQGKNPNEVLNRMLTSGHLDQNQLNQAQRIASQVEQQMSGLKSMFGFR